ncbi:BamA/TamA family outer membrane protein [Altererythrobacter arenosus]|uniref:BamA/TamA family outer membrane protein n=1 Tax=Altererythrobacter arenosus TaxID=3032592 RepID=A0ABY8FSM8_9SPHN|nr:BamA/TamA family outer membrane protein [Altererythrobacter sp. CAU 1644]WFL78024.1 BamA/TamA family outer membrane protein [Altererythrobacter sp. CAU 1644]
MLACGPPIIASAQDRSAPARLEDLIPDSAVDDPENWAIENGDASAPEAEPVLEPDSPMAEMPGLTVEWPEDLDLPEPEPIADAESESQDQAFAELEEIGEEGRADREARTNQDIVRIDDRLIIGFPDDADGFPERTDFIARFKALSTIEELDGDEASVAQIARRAEADEELLERLMRIYGYYNAQVLRTIGAREPGATDVETEPRVRFDILPGKRYVFGAIDLGSLDAAPDYEDLRAAFDIVSSQPLNSDRIVNERRDLDVALGETGYPFAAIEDPILLVDHDREEGDLTMLVEPGGKYDFGEVTSSLPKFLPGKHLETIARFERGEVYQRSLEMDLRRAILATGLVSSVAITQRPVTEPEGDEPGELALDVELQKAKLRTIAGAIGYGTEDGFKVEASWEHRNFFPPEGALKFRAIAGTREQLASVGFKRNNFRRRDQVLTVDAYASNIETDAVEARSVALRTGFERLSNLLFQKPFSWAVGAEVLWTDERNRVVGGVPRPRREYLIGGVFGRATIDTSDSLLDPSEGYRLTAFVAPEVSQAFGTQTFYLRNQLDATYYQPVGEGIVVAGRGRYASVLGAETFEIAPSRRLYSGGGGSVRGYGYQAVGPRNDFGEPTGGRSLVEASLEARVDTGFFDGALQVVPFVDMGTVALGSTPDFRFISWGVGMGVRYKTGFGPIRVDVGVPLNRNPMFDSPVAVYVSLGQAF